jgi:hypothetical protein
MPNVTVVGTGPVTLTTKDGLQISVPLSALYFDSTNKIRADHWLLYAKYGSDVDPWISYLAKNGELTPGRAPAPTPAILVTAADAGQAGNNIQITFSNVTTTTFDALVVETDSYTTLSFDSTSPNFIKKVLGTETIAGSQQGLVHLLDADTPSRPKAQTSNLTGGNAATQASAQAAADPTGNAFTLVAKKNGADGNKTSVTISNVDAGAKTFTLVAVWSSQPITAIKLTDLPDKLTGGTGGASGYEIGASAPAGGFKIPVPGMVPLGGGANQQGAVAATTTVNAN